MSIELPPLTRYSHEFIEDWGGFSSRMVEDDYGEWYAKGEADALITELKLSAKWFGEVMAVLHGDGGHYLAEHGPEKSALDAVAKYHALLAGVGRLRADAERLDFIGLRYEQALNITRYTDYLLLWGGSHSSGRSIREAIDEARGAKP